MEPEKNSLLAEAIRAKEEEKALSEKRLEKFTPIFIVLGFCLLPFVLAWKLLRFAWLVVLSIVLGIVQFIAVCVIIGRR